MQSASAADISNAGPDQDREPDPGPKTIKAQTDIVAAQVCYQGGFDFMLRVSGEYVICLRTKIGAADAVPVKQILEQKL